MELIKRSDSFTPFKDRRDLVARYNKLYSSSSFSASNEKSYHSYPFTFLTDVPNSLQNKKKNHDRDDSPHSLRSAVQFPNSQEFTLSPIESSSSRIEDHDKTGKFETKLLDLVHERKRQVDSETHCAIEPPPPPPPAARAAAATEDSSDGNTNGSQVFMRMMTERSISRQSRISRASTRRDMDIPSLLAFTPVDDLIPEKKTTLEIPAFTNIKKEESQQVPRWSIRKSSCPVCSQKWKDNSTIEKVKSSGLKKNAAMDMPSIIAPARLRAAIAMSLKFPSSSLAVKEHEEFGHGSFLNTTSSAAWQLTRARRFRSPKPKALPSESLIPPKGMTALSQKDVESRVSKFLER